MASDRPTGSVSGTRGWDWNRLMENRKRTATPTRSPGSASDRVYGDPPSADAAIDPFGRAALERGRGDHELRSVITHYERLVSEKDRQLGEMIEQRTAAAAGSPRLLEELSRVVPGR